MKIPINLASQPFRRDAGPTSRTEDH